MSTFQIIKNQTSAYAVAQALFNSLQDGQTVTWNCVTFTRSDDDLIVGGALDGTKVHAGKIAPCELADLLLYPERKQFNDYIRSRLL